MSIDVLITGKMFKVAEQRTGAKGNYTRGKLKVYDGDEQTFCSFIAFSESAQNALLALSDGESVCVTGTAKLKTWTDKQGVTKPQLDLIVTNVMSVYSIKKKREKTQGDESMGVSDEARQHREERRAANPPVERNDDDEIPF